jgi:hypothetical protein
MATRGWSGVTQRDLTQQLLAKQAKRSKYNAKKTTVDGIVFDSAKEATRYGELKVLEKAGEIHCLLIQPSYRLMAANISRSRDEDFCARRPLRLFRRQDLPRKPPREISHQ